MIQSDALFNEDRTERYYLKRVWYLSAEKIIFIGLNPSRGDEINNTPTIERCISIAKRNNFGGFYFFNLFTQVTPYPEELNQPLDKIQENILRIKSFNEPKRRIIFCWGNFKQAQEPGEIFKKEFKNAFCLAVNKNGSPKHPLFCPIDSGIIPYNEKPNNKRYFISL